MRRLLAGMLFLAMPAQAQMYKCVDARGVTEYSDQPCPGGKEVDIRGQPPISGTLKPAKEDLGREDREFRSRQMQRERQDAAQARLLAEEKMRCDALRYELARANAVRRPRDADAHEARLKQLNEQVAKCG